MTAWAKVALALAIAAVAYAGGWATNGWRKDSQINALTAAHNGLIAAANAATAAAYKAGQEKYEGQVQRQAQIDKEKSAQLKESLDETNRLRDCTARGTCGLRIAAVCPARPRDLPSTSPTPSVDDDAGPRLTEDARRNYLALRDAIARVTKQLEGLQALSLSNGKK